MLNFADVVRDLGGDPDAIARAQGVKPSAIGNFDSFIPYSKIAGLLGAAADMLDCPDFGMRLGQSQDISFLGPVAVLLRHSENVADAPEGVCRYLYVCAPPDIAQLKRGQHTTSFTYSIALRYLAHRDQMMEKSLAVTMTAFRLLLGSDFVPLKVSMQHQRISPIETYRGVFGCPVEFGRDENAVEFPTGLLNRAIPGRDVAALALAKAYLAPARPDLGLADNVREMAHRLLKINRANLIAVAETLNLHPRVLQRNLAVAGTAFEDILDDLRRELSGQLAASGMQVSQIATVLGYSEQSSYARACRRWYGMSPRQLANRHGTENGP
ncbi:AraC family transcriptional regulator [Roseomonas mucosa]|nr:AraC family transcriptional regulator [Roseomonas mucosa]